MALGQFDRVHRGIAYDLEIDAMRHDPANRAAIICEAFDLATKEPDPATCKAGPC